MNYKNILSIEKQESDKLRSNKMVKQIGFENDGDQLFESERLLVVVESVETASE